MTLSTMPQFLSGTGIFTMEYNPDEGIFRSVLNTSANGEIINIDSVHAIVDVIKGALVAITALALTGHKWPENKYIKDGTIYDYVIVGAGTAGSIVANRLTEDPGVTVCLIEAGGDPPLESEIPGLTAFLPNTYMDWNFTAEDDGYTAQYRRNKYLDLTSGKVLGGSSTINYFFHVRGDPKDYDDWVKASGDDSWSWQNLLPYFIKSERVEDDYILNSKSAKYHGKNGYMGITRETRDLPVKYLKAFSEVGNKVVLDVNGKETVGYTRPLLSISRGVRQSSAESFLSPIKNRKNLYVMKNTLATKINFDESKRATGVQCITLDGNSITINARKEVIISAGAFNTPKLLMLSGVGPQQHLNSMGIDVVSDLPVGENLQDHAAVAIAHTLEKTNKTPRAANPHLFPFPTFIGLVALNKSQSNPEYMTLNIINRNDPYALTQFCSIVFGFHDDVCEQIYSASVNREVLFSSVSVLRPESSGKVLLRSKNPEDPPKIYTGYFNLGADLERNVDYIEDFIKVTQSTYFKEVGGETIYFDLPNCRGLAKNTRDYWRCYVLDMMVTLYHYSSTCPMGMVLDSNLRVRGVTKLRIVDASAMPNTVSGKVNAAVVVLAERASDIIKQSQCSSQ